MATVVGGVSYGAYTLAKVRGLRAQILQQYMADSPSDMCIL